MADRFDVLVVTTSDKLTDDEGRPRKFFTRVGAMFPNKDGSFGVVITQGISLNDSADILVKPATERRQAPQADAPAKPARTRGRKSSS